MTSNTQMYVDRLHIIKYYLNHRIRVTSLCKRFNRSRTWFYKWKRRHDAYGDMGLMNIHRCAPAQPNQTPIDIEMNILNFIEEHPSYGPARITNEMKRNEITITPSATYNVLKRHNLNTRPVRDGLRHKMRLEHIRIKSGIVATPTDLERARD